MYNIYIIYIYNIYIHIYIYYIYIHIHERFCSDTIYHATAEIVIKESTGIPSVGQVCIFEL